MKRFVDSSGIGRWLLAMALLAACVPYPHPDEPLPPYDATIGTITKIVGSGEVQINGRIVGEGAVMRSGEHIETVADARATLALARGGEVFFDAATDPDLEWLSEAFCKLRIIINVGSILVHTECQTEVETGTGAVVSSLRTMFHLTVNQQWTELTVLKGRVAISGRAGARQIVAAGQQCLVPRGGIAQPPRPVKVRPVIDWACQLDKRLCRGVGVSPQVLVPVPNLVAMNLHEARQILSRTNLQMGRVSEKPTDRNRDDGRVAVQAPEPGTRVAAGAAVDLQVWRYRGGEIQMPRLLNRPLPEARRLLAEKGIRISRIQEAATRQRDQGGRVARQNPAPGTPLHPGMAVELIVYRYERPQPAPVTVPPLTGIHVDRAQAILENAGLKHGRTYQEPAPSRLQIGLVFRQRPEAGAKIDPGGAVDLWVYGAVRLPLRLPTLPQRLPRQPDFRLLPTNE